MIERDKLFAFDRINSIQSTFPQAKTFLEE